MQVGEDEFVELDEEGKPRARTARRSPRRRKAAPARKKTAAPRVAKRKPTDDCGAAEQRAEELVEADPEESAEAFMARREASRARRAAAAPAAPDPADAAARCRRLRRAAARAAVAAASRADPDRRRLIMAVTAEAVKALRERTGAGMMECKKALVETNGDLEAAAEIMRKSGLAKADKKAGRVAAEGVVVIERSADGKQAAVVEVNSETDFVAREKDFQAFAADVAKALRSPRSRPTSRRCSASKTRRRARRSRRRAAS
jgi:NACalpha-BTF3-like transcription factor